MIFKALAFYDDTTINQIIAFRGTTIKVATTVIVTTTTIGSEQSRLVVTIIQAKYFEHQSFSFEYIMEDSSLILYESYSQVRAMVIKHKSNLNGLSIEAILLKDGTFARKDFPN